MAQILLPTPTPSPAPSGMSTEAMAPAEEQAEPQFGVGNELTIAALRAGEIEGSDIVFRTLARDVATTHLETWIDFTVVVAPETPDP